VGVDLRQQKPGLFLDTLDGVLGGASDSVLDALADALRLDEAERAHLLDLARASQPSSRGRRRSATQTVRPSVQWMLDAMTASPAFAENGRLDALGANGLGRALYRAVFSRARQPGNWARFMFFDPEARSFYGDWERAAKDCVAILPSEAGRHPHDRELSDLVGELATKSEEFRGLWAAHSVRLHTKGVKRFNHPVVGELGSHRRSKPPYPKRTRTLNRTSYAAAGGPNQVVSASASCRSVPSPTQATYPSGRINTALGAVTAPNTGSSHTPPYSASIS
jgi:hypothetical protein